MKHTQTPWVVKVYDYPITSGLSAGTQHYSVDIYPTHLPDDETFGITDNLTAADAEFIVMAVNEHDMLKQSLENCAKAYRELEAKYNALAAIT